MKAVAGVLPPDDGCWGYEIKWDGMRVLTFVGGGRARLQSANLREVTARFPELQGLGVGFTGHELVLDGEVVAMDEAGRTSFGRMQTRMHLDDPTEARRQALQVPVTYVVFDLLHLDGNDVMPLPYRERRRLLTDLVEPGEHWSVPAHQVGDGAALLDATRVQGLEGIMAKRLDSIYEPGRRSPSWRKIKNRLQQEFVVGGWAEGERGRGGTVGALLVGAYEGDRLRYCGRVGTGFTHAELDRWLRLLGPLAVGSSPFDPEPPAPARRGARWVRPELVIEVAFGEWTGDGILRHPSYLGQRDDKDPRDVTRAP
jgi:bifunctional non-homologous end joining protein LigD